MKSRIAFIAGRIRGNLEESGTPVTLVWNTWPADAVRDPVSQMFTTPPAEQRREVRAFLHFVNATAQVRQFNEVQVGDCILDLAPDVTLRGLETLRFLLPTGDGGAPEEWTNKPISTQLATFWDTLQQGQRLFQTVLLRKAV